jgi:transcriptional regulator with XRE-family HTH domain
MTPSSGGRSYEITVADRCRIARDEARLGQRELAAAVDVSKGTVTNYEDRRNQSARKDIVLKRWALATGCSYEWLKSGGPDGQDGLPTKWSARGADVLAFPTQIAA